MLSPRKIVGYSSAETHARARIIDLEGNEVAVPSSTVGAAASQTIRTDVIGVGWKSDASNPSLSIQAAVRGTYDSYNRTGIGLLAGTATPTSTAMITTEDNAAAPAGGGADGGVGKRTRKRTGCFTCRRRKKACDEAQPFCSHCQRLDIPCVYPKVGQKRPKQGLFAHNGTGEESGTGRNRATVGSSWRLNSGDSSFLKEEGVDSIGGERSGFGLAGGSGVDAPLAIDLKVGGSSGPGVAGHRAKGNARGKRERTSEPDDQRHSRPRRSPSTHPASTTNLDQSRDPSIPSDSFHPPVKARKFSCIPIPANDVRQVYFDRQMGQPAIEVDQAGISWKHRKVDRFDVAGANGRAQTETGGMVGGTEGEGDHARSHQRSQGQPGFGRARGFSPGTRDRGGTSRSGVTRTMASASDPLSAFGEAHHKPPLGGSMETSEILREGGHLKEDLGVFLPSKASNLHHELESNRNRIPFGGAFVPSGSPFAQSTTKRLDPFANGPAFLTDTFDTPFAETRMAPPPRQIRPLPSVTPPSTALSHASLLPAPEYGQLTSTEENFMDLFAMMHSPPDVNSPPSGIFLPQGDSITQRKSNNLGGQEALRLSPYSRQWLNLSPLAAGLENPETTSSIGLSPGGATAIRFGDDLETPIAEGAAGEPVEGEGGVLELDRLPQQIFEDWQKTLAATSASSIPRTFTPGGSLEDRLCVSSGNLLETSLPAWTWSHVPALIDYFVNGFGPIISVLGIVSKDAFIQSLLPVACESPLLLPALIGWSASHLAPIGEPYASIAKLATAVTERSATSLIKGGMGTDASGSTQDKIWIMLMLGGIGICQGNVRLWNESLPRIRSLLGHLMRSRQPRCVFSDGELALALGCIYYDISASLATARDPGVPLDIYEIFIRQSTSRPEVHMGVAAPLFRILAEITVLAEEASSQAELEDADERFEHLARTLEAAKTLSHRIDLIEVHSRTLTSIAVWRQDEHTFDGQHLFTAFGIFKLAAQAYLRQTVYRSPATTLEAQYSLVKMTSAIKQLLHTPSQSQMLFPLFLAGCDAVRQEDRNWVKVTFQKLHTRTGTGNIQTVFTLLLCVWERNEKGRTWVDWREVADGMDHAVSFA